MLLALDVGNTNIVIGFLDESGIRNIARLETDRDKTAHEYAISLRQVIEFSGIAPENIDGAILSSVVPPINGALIAAVRMITGIRPLVVGPGMKTGLNIALDNPATMGSEKKNSVLTEFEKKLVAYHEVGHAMVAYRQKNAEPVQKITIVPHTEGSLGYTLLMPEEDKTNLRTRDELMAKIAVSMGGRAAEEVAFQSVTTGASNDIEQATKLARAMLTRYGMSKEFDMVALETVNNQYLGGDTSLACSAQTQREIDQRVVELVKAQHEKAIRILTDNRAKLDELAKYLYEKETITGDEFMAILEEKASDEK